MRRRPQSLLHILLGQEAIYLVMAASLFAALTFAILFVRERAVSRQMQQPPIIMLEESKGYFFRSGYADLTPEFKQLLTERIVPVLLDNSERYGASIVEVIGHTDEQPVGASGRSTMDSALLVFLNGQSEVPPAVADNVGLGMSRAAAVSIALKRDPRLSALTILSLSAGQTITEGDTLAAPGGAAIEQTRRRIEIRLRRPT